jgi:hypothetical protein
VASATAALERALNPSTESFAINRRKPPTPPNAQPARATWIYTARRPDAALTTALHSLFPRYTCCFRAARCNAATSSASLGAPRVWPSASR